MVQCRAARWLTGCHIDVSSASDLLETLGSRSLKQSRVEVRLAMLYKIVHGRVSTQPKDHLKHSVRYGKLIQPQMKTDYFRFSFLPRTVKQWRSLHLNATDRRTLQVYNSRVQDMKQERFVQ